MLIIRQSANMAISSIDTNHEFWGVDKLKKEYNDTKYSVSDDKQVYVCNGKKIWMVLDVKFIIIDEDEYYFIHEKEKNNEIIHKYKYKICVSELPFTVPEEYIQYKNSCDPDW